MTEAEWLECGDPCRLLAHLNRKPGYRKLLLYAVACCRAHQHLLRHKDSRDALDWAEQFADGNAQRDAAYERLEWASEGAAFACEQTAAGAELDEWAEEEGNLNRLRGRVGHKHKPSLAVDAAYMANALMTFDVHDPYDPTLRRHARLLLLPPLRDIFGNPFRPVSVSPTWLTSTVVALASQMYESRDFSAMPILADALQAAGCDNTDILTHCRQAGEHVRGCWVVDLVLGKT
jgi:hypothetical protein